MIFFSTHEILGNSSEQIIVLLAFDSRNLTFDSYCNSLFSICSSVTVRVADVSSHVRESGKSILRYFVSG